MSAALPQPAAEGNRTREYPFSDEDFRMIADKVHSWAGISLSENKKALVYSRLAKRLRHLDMPDFRSYCDFVFSDRGGEERDHFLTALTTNVTRFFREPHHFDMLRDEALPDLLAAARAGGRLRIWSAGCSTGQEPYSIAITLLEAASDAARLDLRLLATDIDGTVLAEAAAGRYSEEGRSGLSPAQQDRFFQRPEGEFRTAAPALKELITFKRLNLMEDWPMRGPFDVIFCRNVAIYFDRETQARLWQRFAEKLHPGGWLFIGHSERASGAAERLLSPVGITAYRRSAAPS